MREVFRSVAKESDVRLGGIGTQIASVFAKGGLDRDIPEPHGHRIDPPTFERSLSRDKRRRFKHGLRRGSPGS
jgi:hypothetical protein